MPAGAETLDGPERSCYEVTGPRRAEPKRQGAVMRFERNVTIVTGRTAAIVDVDGGLL